MLGSIYFFEVDLIDVGSTGKKYVEDSITLSSLPPKVVGPSVQSPSARSRNNFPNHPQEKFSELEQDGSQVHIGLVRSPVPKDLI